MMGAAHARADSPCAVVRTFRGAPPRRAQQHTLPTDTTRRTRGHPHGFSDQEAPQAHVEEEAPQAAAPHPRSAQETR